ncbi:MAG TPA: SMP-30/gluconolactonase/LRE family protein [Candidatus Binataceae bacterium]|nr:SMP-30/gluconolactonase/LRE family protein [Candidatus Binataceae bacterium]
MNKRITTTLASGFLFLEGPRWHGGELWMAEIGAGDVVAITADGQRRTIAKVPGTPSGIGFLPDGTPLVVSVRDRKLMRIKGNTLEVHADLSAVSPFLNDMVVDRQGRAYVGNFGFDVLKGEPAKPGSEVLVHPDGRVAVVAKDLNGPNGAVVTSDGRLVVAESFGGRLSSFPIKQDGSLGEATKIPLEGSPDGICLDAGAGIWVALFDKNRFDRVLDGKVVETVETPGRHAIACQLGGADGRTLFCLTYEGALEDIGKAPSAQVETTTVDAPAAGSP